ncbi:MAG: hypothetical protein AAGB05_17180, partial [Pseudomonadota bacterium]
MKLVATVETLLAWAERAFLAIANALLFTMLAVNFLSSDSSDLPTPSALLRNCWQSQFCQSRWINGGLLIRLVPNAWLVASK